MTFINTNGMAFFGPGSEWFWAALQFTALLITFIAIYRQLRIGQSQRAVEQVEGYSRLFENERMIRLKLGTLVALRDGTGISLNVGVPIANYLEDMAALCKRGHLDIKLLWNSLSEEAEIWWFVLQPMVKAARALMGATSYDNWEWLVGDFIEMDRREGGHATIDAEWVDNWLAGGAIERYQDRIRLEQALRAVVIASPDSLVIAQSAAAVPAAAAAGDADADASPTPGS